MAGDLGERLKRARMRAGLTQAQLAAGICTGSFLSFVESGVRAPSDAVLDALCARLGVGVEALLTGVGLADDEAARGEVALAQGRCASGDFAGALEALAPLAAGPLDVDVQLSIARVQGAALEGLGRLADATGAYREALELSREAGDDPALAQTAVDLARCLRIAGNHDEALDVARDVEASLPDAMRGTAPHTKLVATIVGLHYKRGDDTTAHLLAQAALAVLPSGSDGAEVGGLLWNASLAAEGVGDLPLALTLAQRALAAMSAASPAADPRMLGQLHVAIAWLYSRQGVDNIPAAQAELAVAEQVLGPAAPAYDLASLRTEQARIAFLAGDHAGALACAQAAVDVLDRARDTVQVLHALLQVARAQVALGDTAGSLTTCERARMTSGVAEPSRANAHAWRELADAYLTHGLAAEAVELYQRSSREAGL